MTYGQLKSLTSGLLIGDNNIPKDDAIFKSLLSYAFNMISNKAEALRLMTMNSTEDIIRLGPGEYLIRTPKIPESDTEELDIDHELGFVAARYIASMISKDKIQKALRIKLPQWEESLEKFMKSERFEIR